MISRRRIIDRHSGKQLQHEASEQQHQQQQARKKLPPRVQSSNTCNDSIVDRRQRRQHEYNSTLYDLEGEGVHEEEEEDAENGLREEAHKEDGGQLSDRFRRNKRLAILANKKRMQQARRAMANDNDDQDYDDFGELVFSDNDQHDLHANGSRKEFDNVTQELNMKLIKSQVKSTAHKRDNQFKFYKGSESDDAGLAHESLLDDAIDINRQRRLLLQSGEDLNLNQELAREQEDRGCNDDDEDDEDDEEDDNGNKHDRRERRRRDGVPPAPPRGRLGQLLRKRQEDGGSALPLPPRSTPMSSSSVVQSRVKEIASNYKLIANGSGSGSTDCGNFDPYSVYGEEDEEEDVWYSEERLFEDHIQEIVDKWLSIDDEIWAKIICMERNRRIAKAYARSTTITINGSKDDYLDGTTLGLNSFDNPDRDSKTSYIKQYIGEGIKVRIHHSGDIFIKRLSKTSVFVHHSSEPQLCTAIMTTNCLKTSQSSSDLYEMNNGGLGEFYGIVGPSRKRQLINGGGGGGGTNITNVTGFAARSNNRNLSANKGFALSQLQANPSSLSSTSQLQASKLTSASSMSSSSASSSSTSMLAGGRQTTGVPLTPIAKKPNLLQANKVIRLFNMKAFKQALEYESRQPVPNRARLQSMCISIISFVMDDRKLLNLPSWIMIINIVAIDLLSSEIGLVGPYDIGVLPAPNSQPELARGRGNRFSEQRSERVHSPPVRNKSFDQSYNCNDSNNQLGLNNGNDYDYNDADNDADCGRCDEFKLASDGKHELMGSSSSGFNSNCSFQNNSSAASSNSNIALTSSHNEINKDSSPSSCGSDTKIAKKPAKKPSRFKRMFKKSEATSAIGCENVSLGSAAPRTTEAARLRGKRAPKLPHGLALHQHSMDKDNYGHESELVNDHEPTVMSDPIPIPAPPTSAGGASGKANLILVSPTGLSPPTVKRNSGLMIKSDDGLMHKEFSTIKHIDENGRCKVLLDTTNAQRQQHSEKPQKLPTGIPSHAQLAPPATQRHILRYLMSTTKTSYDGPAATGGNLPMPGTNKQQPVGLQTKPVLPVKPPLPPGRRPQRPLPVLPCHQRLQVRPMATQLNTTQTPRSDESLYYSGLQARVPNYQPQHVRPMLPVYPTNKSAIDALLTDFKQSAHYRQQQRKYMLTNMRSNSATQLAEQAEANNLPINYYPGHITAANNRKQLGSDGDNKQVHTRLGPVSKHYGEFQQLHSSPLRRDDGQIFRRSLDNLSRQPNASCASGSHRPLASLLTHVGDFLKRSKAKGSPPALRSADI